MAVKNRLCVYILAFLIFITCVIFNSQYKDDLHRVNDLDIQSHDGPNVLFPKGLRRISQRLEVAEISRNESETKTEMVYEQ